MTAQGIAPGTTVEVVRGAASWVGRRGIVIQVFPRQVEVEFVAGRGHTYEILSLPAVKVVQP